MIGRIEVHAHLLPQRDDGCQSVEESIACARRLVQAGYTHVFCTPHVWPHLPDNSVAAIPGSILVLQRELDAAQVPLTLIGGGEVNLRADLGDLPPEQIVTYGMRGRHVLVDLWADKLPDFFDPTVRRLQEMGLTVILAHPERMRAVQDAPELADHFAELGVLLQGNLQCLSDAPTARTRQIAERFLTEERYFMLGSDLHRLDSLEYRLNGLRQAEDLVGSASLWRLTRDNPSLLLDGA